MAGTLILALLPGEVLAATAAEIVITGSRLTRRDYVSESPITTVSQEAIVGNADITLDTYLNTLPSIVPGGTTISNNPGNGGQATLEVRGMGPNRNLVLIDGRRPMVSGTGLIVDVNTIPASLIEGIEVITGGAGAVYGADAISGVVNIKLRRDFEGVDLRTSYENSTEFGDAKSYTVTGLLGGNFANDRGNIAVGFDRSNREVMYKGQREFARNATSTTGNPPDGVLRWRGAFNPPSQAAIDTLFGVGGYAVPGYVPGGGVLGSVLPESGKIGFNADGSLWAGGTFNNAARDIVHYLNAAAHPNYVNPRFAPDFYSYNFDPVNVLQLPLDRYSFMTNGSYRWDNEWEVFGRTSWTRYFSDTALAPSPVPGVAFRNPADASATQVATTLIAPGVTQITGFIPVPVSNPFIPADLAALLASRTGNDVRLNGNVLATGVLVPGGSGATEAFGISYRANQAGLRRQTFNNTVIDMLGGVKGPIFDSGWNFEAYVEQGYGTIINRQSGNTDTQIVTDLLGAFDGGASRCAGGFNPFGPELVSAECIALVNGGVITQTTEMEQRTVQAFVSGDTFSLPAGVVSVVLGGEYRSFDYTFDPGAASGPISGFNVTVETRGRNDFRDFFGEALIPIISGLDATIGWRSSRSWFQNTLTGFSSKGTWANSYKATLSWKATDEVLVRGSYQRAARAPNFTELFAGGGNFPQIFNPCSSASAARSGPDAVAVLTLCDALNGGTPAGFQENPGAQVGINFRGNEGLKPEKADTFTFGVAVKSPWENPWVSRLSGTLDYYKIKVSQAILGDDVNELISNCFNYLGGNPTYDPTAVSCTFLPGSASWANQGLFDPTDPSGNGYFLLNNNGEIDTSGVDLQVDWGFDLPGAWGSLSANLLTTYLIEYNLALTRGVGSNDYAGTINYFGGGISIGQTLPRIRASINTQWDVGPISLLIRTRYIDAMDNRGTIQYPIEGATFSGVGAQWYFDTAMNYKITDNIEARVGLNNTFDVKPQIYSPNVQSGTDPSTYDVVGRRFFVSLHAKY